MASFNWPPEAGSGDGVTSLNTLTGAITLVAGSGITITPSGSNITIAAVNSGTVTSVSVISANGFAGTVANATTTPAITLSTTVTGILFGNGTSVATAIPSNFPTLNQNTTGTAANVTGVVAIANGGTGAVTANAGYNALSPMTTTGDMEYEVSTGIAARLPIGTTAQVLTVASGIPSWATPSGGTVTSVSVVSANGFAGTVATSTTTPAITLSTTITGILFGNGTSVATAVPSNFPTLNQNTTGTAANITATTNTTLTTLSSLSLPGSQVTGNISGNAANVTGVVAITNGGTGQTTQTTAFDALSPMTTLGDMIYGGTSGSGTRLAGNITVAQQFLSQTGTGSISASPVWSTLPAYTAPTTQVFLSGTGNYTLPTSPTPISIRMKIVAGGGGTAGVGTSGITNGTDGGTTTFGSFSAVGGGGSTTMGIGGTGGSGSVNVIRIPGQNASNWYSSATIGFGGTGGGSYLGMDTLALATTTPGTPSGALVGQNYGSGASGSSGDLSSYGGTTGGGGGEYAETIINTPSSTYSYTVGDGGAAGAGNGSAGQSGSPGIIIIEETYQ